MNQEDHNTENIILHKIEINNKNDEIKNTVNNNIELLQNQNIQDNIINVKKNKKIEIELDKVSELLGSFTDIINSITKMKTEFNKIQNNVKNLEKNTKKYIKTLEKELIKRRPKNKKKPSGFAQPVNISQELCEFLDKPKGTQLARTEVTQYIINYIKCHNLQNQYNKKIIEPDNKLLSLLDITKENELTYFNLQSYMNKHFVQ